MPLLAALTLTFALAVAIPAVLSEDDAASALFGAGALIWSGIAVALS